MVGRHWRHVVLAALAIGVACGVPLATAARRLESVEPTLGRMCPHDAGEGVTVIDDGWKNPVHGLPAIFDFLREAEAGRKILVIGHISDYAGASTPKYIRAMKAALEAADLVISVGPSNESIRKRMDQLDAERLLVLDSLKEVNAYLKETLRPGDLVMLKGSHSADHLERLLLDRTLGVACWQSKCGLRTYCGVCVSRTKPSEPDAA